jgi:hypothetical protein
MMPIKIYVYEHQISMWYSPIHPKYRNIIEITMSPPWALMILDNNNASVISTIRNELYKLN